MKKLFDTLVLVLAINFLVVAGGVGWLFKSGKLDKQKIADIRKMVFPPPEGPSTQPAAADPTTQPTFKLEELLAKQSGRSPGEQVEFIQQTFDTQMAQLDRRQRELADLQRQVDLAQDQMRRDRKKLSTEQTTLTGREQQAEKLANDKGFQDSLARYISLPPKKTKELFMALDDALLVRYLQAMEPARAAKVMKEFKTPDELVRIQKAMEKMRQPQASGQ